jgi:hypothetical protein
MNLLRRFLDRAQCHLGTSGIVGGLILVACVMFYMLIVRPLESRVTQAQEHGSLLHGISTGKRSRTVGDPTYELQTYYQYFARDKRITEWLAKVYSVGESNGVAVRQAEYVNDDDSRGPIGQIRITLPLSGSYPQLRRFITQLLADAPVLSLDQLNLQRRKIGETVLDAELQLTLYIPKQT